MKRNKENLENSHRPPDPLENASILSKSCFYWTYPLLKLGLTRPIEDEDLPELNRAETSEENRQLIQKLWDAEVKSGRKNFGLALLCNYIRTTWDAQILMAINMTARIIQAFALGLLMEEFQVEENVYRDEHSKACSSKAKNGYIYALIMVLCGFIALLSKQHQFFSTYRKGLQLEVGVIAAIYAKTLRLPSGGSSQVTSGHVTNLASNDVNRFLRTSVSLPFLIQGPFIAFIILLVGIFSIGPVFAFAYVLLVLLIPLQFIFGKRFVFYRSKIASITDQRVGIISQVINGARVMKMNSWEHEFYQRVCKLRSKEINLILTASRYKALNEAIYFFTAPVVSVFMFVIHVLLGGVLTPRNVYTTLTFISIVQLILTKHLPNAIMGLGECFVSCRRIQAFLDLPESHRSDDVSKEPDGNSVIPSTKKDENVLFMENVTCYWPSCLSPAESQNKSSSGTIDQKTSKIGAIRNISYTFKEEQIYCIIGKVGSGKSALLQALSGELPVSEGMFENSSTSMSYAAQEPWVMDGTIRENISMGLPFEEEWYNQVMKVCGLVPDMAVFQHGDMTIVGDRGVQCSGGQKARIALARCLYIKDSKIVLLDDPLSAVDAKVAHTIFHDAILNLAVKRLKKCVILVTHQHQFIQNSICILMENGKIRTSGSFKDCEKASIGYLSETCEVKTPNMLNNTIKTEKQEKPSPQPIHNQIDESYSQENKVDVTQAEKRTVGMITRETWLAFGKALGGMKICLVFFFIFALTQGSILFTIVQLGFWAEDEGMKQNSSKWFILILSLTISVVVLSIIRALLSYYLIVKASQNLHDRMLQSVLKTKIEFFDTNPLGRILNRFSADVGIVDETFPITVYDFLVGFFVILGGIFTAAAVLPFILLCLIPLLWVFLLLRKIFITTSRELKRIEGMGRSPIYATLSETLGGIATIRSNAKIKYFKQKFESFQDSHSRAFFAFVATSRWFAFQLDLLAFTLFTVASFLAVLLHDCQWFNIDPAILGLALTLLIQISTTNFPWIVRQSAEVVNQMVSVERIIDFGDLESERYGGFNETEKVDPNWPIDGSIIIENLTTRYRSNLPVALSDISFNIESGKKIGVVGRTGSGKSTLIQALFRLLEAEQGNILIGGVDIATLPLQKLRRGMAVIAQTPVLFGGCSIRENLDPFGEYADDSIYEALTSVQMMDFINDMQYNLDTCVADGGSNFSVGQRQLLCLARTLLGQSKILILDEPTANVDTKTDQLLQKTLKDKFSHATIISVAHRLDTIINYDHILVLSNGNLVEFGHPKDLLLDGNSYFSSMVQSTGVSMSNALHREVFLTKPTSPNTNV